MQPLKFIKRNVNRIAKAFLLLSVARTLCLGFTITILIGSFGIYISESGRLSYTVSLYLATSSICVTGLSPVLLSELQRSTQLIMMFLIQIGGLGIITFTVLIGVLVVRGLSRSTRLASFVYEATDAHLAKRMRDKKLEQQSAVISPGKKKTEAEASYVRRMLISLFNITLSIEAVGATLLFFCMPETDRLPGTPNRFFLSIFTSISAFNNAGFSIVDDLSFLSKDPLCLLIVQFLIVMGGIGFPVIIFIEKSILEIIQKFMGKVEAVTETFMMRRTVLLGEDPPAWYIFVIATSVRLEGRLEIYRKELFGDANRMQMAIIVLGSLILIHIGGIAILLIEYNNVETIGKMVFSEKLFNSFFLSVSSRTAGFNTFDIAEIESATYVLLCALMFIGGGPQGAAGGIKITTFFILILYLKNVIRPQARVQAWGEDVSKNSVAISTRIYFLATISLVVFMFLITLANGNRHGIETIFFEVMSAFGTVGLSLGMTAYTNDLEKFLYIALMFMGRVGTFTLLIAFTGHSGLGDLGGKDDGLKIQVG
ncbi:TrkH family potassium uptake protein [Leptospira interrogans]|uniref:Potassium uptake transporter n=1 Tax=Leptospira interrogans serogroup Icterohaemorrhagiae serovar Lai (strain 56601) TaxID=189518 RepID=Q8F982_LEPIN|nr:potassium transporter TrkG [Leptospira interrogans]AAN47513.1 potassium uptake transporter [Leptospira interrogans serovar Lai str. 56601]AER01081.1 potassium uptake transporter [Leptospira interrogans serovar Lai str. IPAV]